MSDGMLTATTPRAPMILAEPILGQSPSCLDPQFALRHNELSFRSP